MRSSLIISLLALAGAASSFILPPQASYRVGTSTHRNRIGSKHIKGAFIQSRHNDNLPRGYAGAKFARKAAQKVLGIKHITMTH